MPGTSLCPSCGYDVEMAELGVGEALPGFVEKEIRRPRPGSKSSAAAPRQRKRLFLVVIGTAAVLIAVAVIGVAIFLSGGRSEDAAAPSGQGVISFDWPPEERYRAKLQIDDRPMRVPEDGPVRYKIAAGTHRIRLERDQFKPIEQEVEIKPGEPATLQPLWRLAPLGGAEPEPAGKSATKPPDWPPPGKEKSPAPAKQKAKK